eukprot:CAMPEP_0173153570 /NCGR_PEP_ID=MMETSP1105-20130129/12939_1 /TAXON_ID=2985 /ORGANISM="Ochromonas sp., Strain BG-1" /LENGTH=635 /DNA_ID=CAMNT_0014069531 /DNA_START=1 /DNA_END=1908 /DNA_ORIENTATION=-
MPRSGTLVICVQNLDCSGANQVVLNLVEGKMHEGNVVVLSPKSGPFAVKFLDQGASVRIGSVSNLLNDVKDIFCLICNTIMTANIVVEMAGEEFPTVWILHEWWDDEMIKESLRIRNYKDLTLETVKEAMKVASRVVCVCDSQKQLYHPDAPSSVIFVGVPDPCKRLGTDILPSNLPVGRKSNVFTFLCLGIICPRKNQLWTIRLFKAFAADRQDVRLQIVGARYIRDYEIEYLDQIKKEIGDDPRIEIHDVTHEVDQFFKEADALILTSLNEVTPMVISEAMSWGIPVLSTNIAGIKEMYHDGVEGFHFSPGDKKKALKAMKRVYQDDKLRHQMGIQGRARFETTFDLSIMVESYRQIVLAVAPPVILIDMDGVLVDWDKGFLEEWKGKTTVDRSQSYYMEKCVPESYQKEAELLFHQSGFFLNLPWMEGAQQAIQEMKQEGLQVYLCTSPLVTSKYCAQEKLEWVRIHLGESWVDKVILCQDKSKVKGDILIDDKPYDFLAPNRKHNKASWRQIIFDAPYNRQLRLPRLNRWSEWKKLVYGVLGSSLSDETLQKLSEIPRAPSPISVSMDDDDESQEESIHAQRFLSMNEVSPSDTDEKRNLEEDDDEDHTSTNSLDIVRNLLRMISIQRIFV